MTGHLSLIDAASQTVNGKTTSKIVELMTKPNPILQDLHIKECNDGTTNITVARGSIPEGEPRAYYDFSETSTSGTFQVVDKTCMTQMFATSDAKLVKHQKDPAQFRLNQSKGILEGLGRTVTNGLIYGSIASNKKWFDGLAVRFSTISTDESNIGSHIVDAAGTTGNLTSMYFVTTGENDCSMIYPEGSEIGISHTDRGEKVEDLTVNGVLKKRVVFEDQFDADYGLSMEDFRGCARIANIPVADLAGSTDKLLRPMNKAFAKIMNNIGGSGQKTFIYCNLDVYEHVLWMASEKSNAYFQPKEYGGFGSIPFYKGIIPVRCLNHILNTEERVV